MLRKVNKTARATAKGAVQGTVDAIPAINPFKFMLWVCTPVIGIYSYLFANCNKPSSPCNAENSSSANKKDD